MAEVGRPRSETVTARVHAAVLDLLHAEGPAAVTVEAVAARSGVAKTSVYRRHRDRDDLLRTVLREAVGTPRAPAEGSVRDRIRAALEEVWRQMSEALGPGGLGALVAGGDAELSGLLRDVLRPYERALVAQIEADARAGLLPPDVDAEGVVTLFVGAYLGEVVRSGSVGADWLDRCLDLMWATLTAGTA